jgi:hypothetical protein
LSVGAVGAAARLSSLHWRSKHRVEATMSDKSKTVRMRRWRRRKLVRSRVIRVEITEAEIAALGRIGYKPEKQDDAAAIGDALTAFISDSLLEFVTS